MSIGLFEEDFFKSNTLTGEGMLLKGRKDPVGTIKTWGGKTRQKQASGEWKVIKKKNPLSPALKNKLTSLKKVSGEKQKERTEYDRQRINTERDRAGRIIPRENRPQPRRQPKKLGKVIRTVTIDKIKYNIFNTSSGATSTSIEYTIGNDDKKFTSYIDHTDHESKKVWGIK